MTDQTDQNTFTAIFFDWLCSPLTWAGIAILVIAFTP